MPKSKKTASKATQKSNNLQYALGWFMWSANQNQHLQIWDHVSQLEKGDCQLRVRNELLPQVEEFKYLRVLFRVKLEWSGRVTDWRCLQWCRLCWFLLVKRELSVKAKLCFYWLILSYPHLWTWALVRYRKNEIVATNGRNKSPSKGGWAFP